MFFRDWLHSFRTPATPRRSKPKRRSVRLHLERLEDRITPTTTLDVANAADLQNAINNQVDANPAQQYILNFTGSTYNLNDIGDQLTISNSAGVTFQGNGATLDAAIGNRLFTITAGSHVAFKDLTLEGGSATGQGGGILDLGGNVTLSQVVVQHNQAVGFSGASAAGGCIYVSTETLTVLNSIIRDNSAIGGLSGTGGDGQGGGLYNLSGAVQMINSIVASNTVQGGAGGAGEGSGVAEIDSASQSAYINDTFTANTASASGGGFFVTGSTPVLTNTMLENNTALTGPDYSGAVNANSNNNFVSNTSGATTFNATNILNVGAPQLGAAKVGPNGTTYYPLLLTSQAINAGSNSVLSTIAAAEGVPVSAATDQIGTSRLIGPAIDIGAAEVPDPPTTTTVANVTTTFSPAAHTVTLSAAVTSAGDPVPIGTVTFTVTCACGNVVGSPVTVGVSAVTGQATAPFTVPAGQAAGTYIVTAVYNDSTGVFDPSTGTGTLTISSAPSATTVTNVSSPFTTADPDITLTATVTSGGAAVNEGQVQFMIAGLTAQPIVAPVVNGQASATFSVPANAARGNYAITATFVDSTNNFVSSVGAGTLTIFPSPTTVTINNVSIVYGLFGVQETLAAVVRNAVGVVVNEGFVTFSDGGQTMTAPIVNGLAIVTLNIPFFSENPFAHNVSLAFGDGTGNFLPSTSLSLLEQTLQDFLLQLLALFSLMQSDSGNT